jgi:purine-nucleoside phosphorylase
METAALYAVCQAAGIQAASILVVGDDLSGGKWLPPGDMGAIEAAFARVYGTVINLLA